MAGRYKPLSAILKAEPYRFDFFQAVRILERLDASRKPVGMDGPIQSECVRFRSHLALDFPASAIYRLDTHEDEFRPSVMEVTFIGLTGPSGSLPRCYTEILLDRQRSKDATLREFLDLFNHRLISLFYRAWERNRFYLGYERAEKWLQQLGDEPSQQRAFLATGRAELDRFSQMLLELCGMGHPSLRLRDTVRTHVETRLHIADSALRYYSGLFAQQQRSAAGLEGLVADYFSVSTAIVPCVGQWLMISPPDQTRLTGRNSNQLGMTAIAGARFWDRQGRFRVRLGPLTYPEFSQFLPNGRAHPGLRDLIRLYVRQQYDIELQLVLKASEVPECCLSQDPGRPQPMLGWNTWLLSNPASSDSEDSVLLLE